MISRGWLLRAAAGAAATAAARRGLLAVVPPGTAEWTRTNHRGRALTLLDGPAVAAGAAVAARVPGPAAAVAAGSAAAAGRYDDLAGSLPAEHDAKGFRGHLRALRAGQLTGGGTKLAAIGAGGVVSAALLPGASRRPLDLLVDGGVVAATANLANLLDLRPGRALKAVALAALALDEPGIAGAAAAGLPRDLGEHAMLGDAGANPLGALLGLALLRRLASRRGRWTALAVLTALNASSELVSFSRVIDATPPLRALDRLGRLP